MPSCWNAAPAKASLSGGPGSPSRPPKDEPALRNWLTSQGVEGYPQQLLVFETFGYPDFLTATADDLIDAQYADRPALRPILEGVIEVAGTLGEVAVQARKGFVTLQTTRRKFAVIKPATKTRVDLGLRIAPNRATRASSRPTRHAATTCRPRWPWPRRRTWTPDGGSPGFALSGVRPG